MSISSLSLKYRRHWLRLYGNKIIFDELKRLGISYHKMNIERAILVIATHHNLELGKTKFKRKYTVASFLHKNPQQPITDPNLLPVTLPPTLKRPPLPQTPPKTTITEDAIKNFYVSWEWKRLSYDIKLERGRKCECCGAKAPDVRIITDHIKPLRKYWSLRLVRSNLQVLCDDCNMGKGSRDETDFREVNISNS